jgi:hypothetical protein
MTAKFTILAAENHEGMPDELRAGAWVLYALAVIVAFLGLVMRVQRGWPKRTLRKMAFAAILLCLLPLAWHFHIYQLAASHYRVEGRPRCGSIWNGVVIPSLPILAAFIVVIPTRRQRATA